MLSNPTISPYIAEAPVVWRGGDFLGEGWENVNFVRHQYSKSAVDRAGEVLATRGLWVVEREGLLSVVNNWRACHAYPLQCYYVTLNKRAKKVDDHAAVAQRMKRLASITTKLERNRPTDDEPDRTKMKLTSMQDIGGCRAILKDVGSVRALVEFYKNDRYTKNIYRDKDYIANPKDDGYRCVHLIYRYKTTSTSESRSELLEGYNGLRIEIQVRSRLQHLWATAVEIVDIFTGQEIKLGKGKADWKRFLLLMSNDIAARERCPLVPGAPTNLRELKEEIRHYVELLDVFNVMEGWRALVQFVEPQHLAVAEGVILELDPKTKKLNIYSYGRDEIIAADKLVYRLEREHENDNVQVVRVSANSLKSLKSAFPNFYLNSSSFLAAVRRAIGVLPSASPSAS
jgi:hypothetical protein